MPFIGKKLKNIIYFKDTLAYQRTVNILSFPSALRKFIARYGYSAGKETNTELFRARNCTVFKCLQCRIVKTLH
jgi:hypothetical protein